MKTEFSLLVGKQYHNGQTDGMNLYKVETTDNIYYVFAASLKDARIRYRGNLTVPYASVRGYLQTVN
jgi:hypothetical protein